jgi:radical SAM superfamily enzyme YgiQ (UPF0313 family)
LLPADWSVRLVDATVRKLTDKHLAWADYAFISGMVVQRESAGQIISRCKEAGVTTVAGGPLFTGEHADFGDVDHFVLNEAELTLPRFLKDLKRGCPERLYTTAEFADIRRTPAPRWELAELDRYASMSIQYSRGCPYDCEFCNVTTLFGHRWRTKTTEQVIAELDGLHAAGWRRGVFFVDDNLIGNRRALKEDLLPALIEWQKGKDIPLQTQLSIDLADDEPLTKMMVDAGFRTVFIGIETPDEESLSECNKRQNKGRNLLDDVKRLQRAGLEVQGGFIVGFDHDFDDIFQRQIEFIQKSGIVTAMVGLLQAPPGTRLYDRLEKGDRLRAQGSGDNVDGTTNIVPIMDLSVLRQGYERILQTIYSPKHYYKRVRTFLREYKAPAIHSSSLSARHILAFLRSTIRLGIVGRERLQYWKLLLWTTFCRPKQFAMAVTFAIYGFHFRKTCKRHVAAAH